MRVTAAVGSRAAEPAGRGQAGAWVVTGERGPQAASLAPAAHPEAQEGRRAGEGVEASCFEG